MLTFVKWIFKAQLVQCLRDWADLNLKPYSAT